MIINRTYELDRKAVATRGGLLAAVESVFNNEPLRWFVSAVDATGIKVEATECAGLPVAATEPVGPVAPSGRAVVVNLVPTGIQCAIGGYAGDAAPATALIAAACDLVVTNPNAVNASDFVNIGERIVYTEGHSLDLFSRGVTPLYRPRANRIGVIIERAHRAAVDQVLNVINAVRAVHGVEVVDYLITDRPIGTRCIRNASGAYVGQVEHPDVLLTAGKRLLNAGATALAVTTNVRGLSATDYASHFTGEHPNPVGGAEAIASHLLTRALGVPSAHAPMMNFKDLTLDSSVVDARGAGEFISTSGLACVLIGLRRAPQLTPRARCAISETIAMRDVIAVVTPASALGGVPVLSAIRQGIPVIAVRENSTILDVTADQLGLNGVFDATGYLDAVGMILALRNGISIESLRRPLATLGAIEKAMARESA